MSAEAAGARVRLYPAAVLAYSCHLGRGYTSSQVLGPVPRRHSCSKLLCRGNQPLLKASSLPLLFYILSVMGNVGLFYFLGRALFLREPDWSGVNPSNSPFPRVDRVFLLKLHQGSQNKKDVCRSRADSLMLFCCLVFFSKI